MAYEREVPIDHRGSGKMDGCATLWERQGSCGPTRGDRPDLSAAATAWPQPSAGAEHPGAAAPASAGRERGDRRGAARGSDHPLHRQHAVRLPAPRNLRLLDRSQPRLGPRRPRLGPLVRRPGDGRVRGGHLPFDLRVDQPEPHGRGGGQAGRPRPAGQPARGARGHQAGHAGVGDSRPDGGENRGRRRPGRDHPGRRPRGRARRARGEQNRKASSVETSRGVCEMTSGDDGRIQGDVSERLTAELPDEAAQIQVNVTHGEVTLAGTVDTSEARRRAENVAESTAGVVSVMNDLRVRQPGGTGATG